MKKIIVLIIFLIASTGYSLTVNISGVIHVVADDHNVWDGYIAAGDTFTGSYTYDDTPDWVNHATYHSTYHYLTGTNGVTIQLNDFVFKSDLSNLDFSVSVHNDRNDVIDSFSILSKYSIVVSPDSSVTGNTYIHWSLGDTTMTAVSNTDLPDTAMNLSDWNSNSFMISDYGFVYPYYPYIIAGEVTSTEVASTIPEPLSLLLCTLSIFLLWLRKRFL